MWKSTDGIEGICMSVFRGDATPPEHWTSEKRIQKYLESDEWRDRTLATDTDCRFFAGDYGFEN